MDSVIILHGALGSAHQFEPLTQYLSQQYHIQSSVLEFYGHGAKPDIEQPWTIELFSEQLHNILKENKNPARIFGYSMGGYVAIELAKKNPENVHAICTLGTKLEWSPESAALEAKRLNADILQEKVPAFASDLQRRHGAEHWKTVLRKTAGLMKSLGDTPTLTPQSVSNLTTPVRMAVGDRDEMVSIEETLQLYRALPMGSFAVLPGTRHPIEKINVPLLAHYIFQALT